MSEKYDSDEKNKDDFYTFDARGKHIRIYNENITNQSNTFKTWIVPIEEESTNYEVTLSWKAPSGYDRISILNKEVLTAFDTYILLQEKLLPKARKLFKKV